MSFPFQHFLDELFSYQESGEIFWLSLLSQKDHSKNKLRARRIQTYSNWMGPQEPGEHFVDGFKYSTAIN